MENILLSFIDIFISQSMNILYGLGFAILGGYCVTMQQNAKKLEREDYERAVQPFRAKKNEGHIQIGQQQKLFFFDQYSPGSCFWLPAGARMQNKLRAFLRKEYQRRGYLEVMSPNIYNVELFEKSGHMEKYVNDMFLFNGDFFKHSKKPEFALKPMNCPAHCCMFKHLGNVSVKQLPIRFADFGALHRNEKRGALKGLLRNRKFCQDDAHIFCLREQMKQEIAEQLEFMKMVYSIFGFEFELKLSTRPEQSLGDDEIWEEAEASLKQVLNGFCEKHDEFQGWSVAEGDGAFYGPKIDIYLRDNHGKQHQAATVQLDFQMPIRFALRAFDHGEIKSIVMIHRAIFGSFERFSAILLEHCNGRLPFWLSPRQVKILSIHKKNSGESQKRKVVEFARKSAQQLQCEGFHVEVDVSNSSGSSKLKKAMKECHSVFLFVGLEEAKSGKVSVRVARSDLGKHLLVDCIQWLHSLEEYYH